MDVFDHCFIQVSHEHTTEYDVWIAAISILHSRVDTLFELTRHSYPSVRLHASLLVRFLILHLPVNESIELQNMARGNGCLVWQLILAIEHRHDISKPMDELQILSRNLVALFCLNNTESKELLTRIFPV